MKRLNSFTSCKQFRSQRNIILLLVLLLCALSLDVQAQTKRVVIIKVDGLPNDVVDQFVHERDPQTGKSLLPWFDHIFYQNGTRVANFYVRGTSLSGPSWSQIDTGQHAQIKGNAEFDRATAFAYDYFGILPYYAKQAAKRNVDMPGPEVLDSLGIRLLMDAYDNDERLPGLQIYQRGGRLGTLQRAGEERFLKNPKDLWDEINLGFDLRDAFTEQVERELIEALRDPHIRYLDLMTGSFDHQTHANGDRAARLATLRDIDGILQEVWEMAKTNSLQTKTVKPDKGERGPNYSEQPIQMSLSGNFNGFYSFLLQLEKLSRITRISQLKLEKITTKEGDMQAQMTMSIFFESDGSSKVAGTN